MQSFQPMCRAYSGSAGRRIVRPLSKYDLNYQRPSAITDVSDLAGTTSERHRVWDSCFSAEYSYIHGGAVRESTRSRYRQWMTHKLAAWKDQFGTSGCVGCGRCITWCPAAIDITVEAGELRRVAEHREERRARQP